MRIIKDGETSLILRGWGVCVVEHSPRFPKHGGIINGSVLLFRSAIPLCKVLEKIDAKQVYGSDVLRAKTLAYGDAVNDGLHTYYQLL